MRFLFLLLLLGQAVLFAQPHSLPAIPQPDSLPLPKLPSTPPIPTDTIATDTVTAPNSFITPKTPQQQETVVVDSVTIKDYRIIPYKRDSTFVDTTLTLQKEYQHNYLRKDDFELMSFANIGQPYNVLGKTFSKRSYYPRMGATARHYNYFEVQDIAYYRVPTPMTELMFKSTLEEGQLLDALLTFNLSKHFNASVAYKGFRSLGKYQFEQVKSENFSTTLSYITPNRRYTLRGHIAAQNIEAQENGGLLNREQFEGGSEEFQDRSRIDVRLTDANSTLVGKRYFLDHQLALTSPQKEVTPLTLGHEISYETKFYKFDQAEQNDAFGEAAFVAPIEDRARLKTLSNTLYTQIAAPTLGNLRAHVGMLNYNYFFNSILITEQGLIPNQLEGQEIAVGGRYAKTLGPLSFTGDITYTLSGELTGNRLTAQTAYHINPELTLQAGLHRSLRMPDFNYLLYQSDYRNFNWDNTAIFEEQQLQNLQLGLHSKTLGRLEAAYSRITNYTYFESTISAEQLANGEQATAFVEPFQEPNPIDHLRVQYTKEFRWDKWALRNTVLFQDVRQDKQVLNLPQWLTQNTVYFSAEVFKRAMFLQTGLTFKYFTAYNMNAYHPLLGEFFVQNNEAFGAYPLLDFFINAKVKQTRIFLKAEHFNSIFSTPNYFAAPDYPYRDFVIRFGLVWHFFS